MVFVIGWLVSWYWWCLHCFSFICLLFCLLAIESLVAFDLFGLRLFDCCVCGLGLVYVSGVAWLLLLWYI